MLQISRMGRERESVSKKGERWASSGLFLLLTSHWPHVDEILSESNRLAVATDGDRPVQVGRRVPVLAIRDPDHCSADLPAQNLSSDFFRFTAENDSRYWSMFVPARWTWVSQIILMFTAVAGNTIWHIVPASSLRGIFCVSQIICEALGGGEALTRRMHLISAIFEPPFPMTHPMISLGTVISWVWWVLAPRPPPPPAGVNNFTKKLHFLLGCIFYFL